MLFFLACLFLIFTNIPEDFHLNFIGIGGHLSGYPILMGFILMILYIFKNKHTRELPDIKRVSLYILIYLGIVLASTINGLFIFPYFDKILSGPMDQIEKLPFVYNKLKSFGIDIDSDKLMLIWTIARTIKGVFLSVIWSFGISYLVYCWYKNQWKCGFYILLKGTLIAILLVIIYSFIDVFYLCGNETAKWILTILNPIVHNIKEAGTWYPPLLWNGQLRSLFTEPSYFGMYFAFSIPFLWYLFYRIEDKKIIIAAIISLYTFFLFLTKARTANFLLLGELVLLVGFSLFNRKAMLKKAVIIVFCSLLSFIVATSFINNMFFQNKKSSNVSTVNNAVVYLEDNLGSLTSIDKRSNRARFSIMITDIKIGLDHPLLGVGNSLRNAYVSDYLPEESFQSGEVRRWMAKQKEQGILKAVVPGLSEYTNRFAINGALGLMAFLFPIIILFIKLMQKIIRTHEMDKKYLYIFFTISFMGMLACGLGDSLNITYCLWILLGLGYAMCFGKENSDDTMINNKNNE